MLNAHLDGDNLSWECPDEESVRYEMGGYWAWRRTVER